MIGYLDNKGFIDLINGWSVGGGTKHMDCRIMFLRELKENETIRVLWIATDENTSDIFTKNVGSPAPVPANTCTPINGKSHNTRQGVSLGSFQPCHVCYVVIIF